MSPETTGCLSKHRLRLTLRGYRQKKSATNFNPISRYIFNSRNFTVFEIATKLLGLEEASSRTRITQGDNGTFKIVNAP